MSQLELGQRVRFTHVLGRETHYPEGLPRPLRRWDAFAHEGEGVVYGVRTLSNGHVETIREYDGYFGSTATHTEYSPTEHFEAYLVATHLRHRPVVVKSEHAEVIQ